MCFIKKSVHCLTSILLTAIAEDIFGLFDAGFWPLEVLLPIFDDMLARVCITFINCFCTSNQLSGAFESILLHKSMFFERVLEQINAYFCVSARACVSWTNREWEDLSSKTDTLVAMVWWGERREEMLFIFLIIKIYADRKSNAYLFAKSSINIPFEFKMEKKKTF